MKKVFLIASGKGGTGKTMFAVNFGALLAQKGKRVALIDMDLGMRNMDLYLGMENRVVFNIMDVMSGICRLNKALIKVSGFDSLYFIAASPRRDERRITERHMTALCEALSQYFDFIIIDCGAGMGDLLDVCLPAAQRVVLITEPEVAALRDADTLAAYLSQQGMSDICMVINKVDTELVRAGVLPDISSIISSAGAPVVGMIEMDSSIRISTSRGIPAVCREDSAAEETFREIAGRILGLPPA